MKVKVCNFFLAAANAAVTDDGIGGKYTSLAIVWLKHNNLTQQHETNGLVVQQYFDLSQ